MYNNVVTAIDKIHTYLLRFNTCFIANQLWVPICYDFSDQLIWQCWLHSLVSEWLYALLCFWPMTMPPDHGSLESEWLWCLTVLISPADNFCPWLFSLWVAVVTCCVFGLLTMPIIASPVGMWLWCSAVSSLLTMPVLHLLACEWLYCLAVACWQCPFLALQPVSGCGTLL